MLVVMTVRTVLKVPLEKAAPPPCPFDVPAPLNEVKFLLALSLGNREALFFYPDIGGIFLYSESKYFQRLG